MEELDLHVFPQQPSLAWLPLLLCLLLLMSVTKIMMAVGGLEIRLSEINSEAEMSDGVT